MEKNLKINDLEGKVKIIPKRFYMEPKTKGGRRCETKRQNRAHIYR